MVDRKYVTEWTNRSLPAVLVVLLWAGLWQLWPKSQPYTWRPEPRPFKVTFVDAAEVPTLAVDPTAFAFDSEVSYQPEEEVGKDRFRMPEMSAGRQEFMPMSEQVLVPLAPGPVSDYSVWEKRTNEFSGVWHGKELFGQAKKSAQWVVLLSDDLERSGFAVPEPSEDELKVLVAGWEIQFLVDIDKSGVPVHVLVEKGTGNKDIDSLICGKILLGRADKKEAKGGRVTVSYGSE